MRECRRITLILKPVGFDNDLSYETNLLVVAEEKQMIEPTKFIAFS